MKWTSNEVMCCHAAWPVLMYCSQQKENRKTAGQQRQEKYSEKGKAAACAEVAPEYDPPETHSSSSSEISSDEEFLVST